MTYKALIVTILMYSPWLFAQDFVAGDTLIIEYDNRSNGIINNDSTPLLQVFGDGKIIVVQPWHRKDQGIYKGQLNQRELQLLQNQLILRNAFEHRPDYVEGRAKSEIQRIEATSGVAIHHSETITSRFEFAKANEKTLRKSTWINLQRISKRVDSIDALTKAAETEQLLQELLNHTSLIRTADAPFGGLTQ